MCGVLLSVVAATAQNTGSLTATLRDAKSGEGVNGAVVELLNTATNTSSHHISGYKGAVEIKNLAPAEYRLKITFLGYREYETKVKITASKSVNLGVIKLKQDATVLESIEVKGYMGTSSKGDTVSYNAASFKTARDASVEGLLSKMPGVTVNSDGTVDAQGESVQKVFVDGKEFFGEDVSTTIKSIPAEMISKVEVYDKLSDKAEFTGLDDGEGYKAINLVTKLGKRKGVFGKVYGSYGLPDKYTAGGNVNIFNGDQKFSVIAMANNINQTNFSFEDIVGATSSGSGSMGGGHRGPSRNFFVHPQAGIATVQSVGLNYSNEWKDKLELQGSYFFNHSNTINEQTIDKQTFSGEEDGYTEVLHSNGSSLVDNYNHRMNLRLDYTISKTQSLRLRAGIGLQQYDNRNTTNSLTTNGTTGAGLKEMVEQNNDLRTGSYGNIFALYRLRLGKPGRTITASTRFNWNDYNSLSTPLYQFTIPTDSTYQRQIDSHTGSNRIRGEVSYTEPLSDKAQINIEYEFSHKLDDQNKLATVNIDGTEYPTLGELLSNISNSYYTIHEVGPGINFSSKKVKFSFRVNYQYSLLDSKQTLPAGITQNYTFNDLTYQGNATVNFNAANALRIRMRSYTSNPSISQLQEAVDVHSSSYTAGNPDLKPSYSHDLNLFYTNTDIESGRTLMLHGGIWGKTRSIISAMQMNNPDYEIEQLDGQRLGEGNTFLTYENHSGLDSWNSMAGISFGFPLNIIKSNITLNSFVNFSSTPSKINDQLNIMRGANYSGGVQIGSNVSENLDFTFHYSLSYSINNQNSSLGSQQNRYFSQFAKAEMKWIFWKGITFTANGTYNQYKGITDDYNEEILLCNAYLGTKLFRDQRGELSIGINDIFNQNKDFKRTVGANYIQNTTNLAIGRYAAVQFVYNIRWFGKGSSAKDFDNIGGMGGGPGRGPGRGRPF